jgi:hypothetical protein
MSDMELGGDPPHFYSQVNMAYSYSGSGVDLVYTNGITGSAFVIRYMALYTPSGSSGPAWAGVYSSVSSGALLIYNNGTAQGLANVLCFGVVPYGMYIGLQGYTGVFLAVGGYYVPAQGATTLNPF